MKKLIPLILVFLLAQNCITAYGANNPVKKQTRTDICKDNYRTLFKGEALQTSGDDPEMMAILQRAAYSDLSQRAANTSAA